MFNLTFPSAQERQEICFEGYRSDGPDGALSLSCTLCGRVNYEFFSLLSSLLLSILMSSKLLVHMGCEMLLSWGLLVRLLSVHSLRDPRR